MGKFANSRSGICKFSSLSFPYFCFGAGFMVFVTYIVFVGFSFPRSSVKYLPNTVDTFPKLVSLRALLSGSISAAENGGKEVYAVRKGDLNEQSKGKTREGANDPLTNGDLYSHYQMYYGLRKVFPNLKIISEEHSNEPTAGYVIKPVDLADHRIRSHGEVGDESVNEEDVTIWIDPLDATKEYTEKLLQYVTTMVCVAVKGVPVIGVIHKPFEGVTAWAWAGNFISKEVSDMTARSKSHVNQSDHNRIIVSRSHAGKVSDIAKKSLGLNTEVIPAGGAGYKALEVVAGHADAYIHSTLIKKWDICAGNAILNAIGGQMTKLNGEKIDYGSYSNVKNEGGLLASMKNHSVFINKLQSVVN